MERYNSARCGEVLKWASQLLALDIHSLSQFQNGALYLLILDAFYADVVPLCRVYLTANQQQSRKNFDIIKGVFQMLGTVKFMDVRHLISDSQAHGPFLHWLHGRCQGLAVRNGYEPQAARMQTRGGNLLVDAAIDAAASPATLDTHASATLVEEAPELQQAAVGRPVGSSRLAAFAKRVAAMAPQSPRGTNPRSRSAAAVDSPKQALRGPNGLSGRGGKDTSLGSAPEPALCEVKTTPDRANALHSGLPAVPEEAPADPTARAGLRHLGLPDTPMAACSRRSSICSSAADGVPVDAAPAAHVSTQCGTGSLPALSPVDAAAAAAARDSAAAQLRQMDSCDSGRAAVAEDPGLSLLLETPTVLQGKQGPLRRGGADSASSLARKARGGMAAAATTARRKAPPLQEGQQLLSPEDATLLAESTGKLEEADDVARAAARAILQAIPELQAVLDGIGSSTGDGRVSWAKLRSRGGLVAAMLPSTRELLRHTCQLSELAGADVGARTRARRARRLLKDLAHVDEALLDIGNRIAKAERYFPACEASAHPAANAAADQAEGQRSAALEGTLRAVGEAMAAMQALWERLAPHSDWANSAQDSRDAISAMRLGRRKKPARKAAVPSRTDGTCAPACSGVGAPEQEEPAAARSLAERPAGPADSSTGAGVLSVPPPASPDAAASETPEEEGSGSATGKAASKAAGPDAEARPAEGSPAGPGTCSTGSSPVLTPEKEWARKAQRAAKQLLLSSRPARGARKGSRKRWSPSVQVPAPAYIAQQAGGADAGCSITARPTGSAAPKEAEREPPKQIKLPGGDVYAGTAVGEVPDGVGVLELASTLGRYEGEFMGGAFEGLGAETLPEGTYMGAFRAGQREGVGVCHFRNADFFRGEWRGGLQHGSGMQHCTDGSHYVGGYEAGARAGRGLYIFPNGDRYEGGVAADLPQGAGVYHFAAGNARLEGAWLAGRCHGWGLLTLGERQIYGRWEAGEAVHLADLAEPNPAAARAGTSGRRQGDRRDDETSSDEELDSAEAEARDLAAESARTARAAAARAAAEANEHCSASNDMQATLQTTLERAQSAARAARRKAAAPPSA